MNIIKQFKKINLWHGVWLISRLVLGGLFIFASVDKIINPDQFAQVVHNYKIVPNFFIIPLAVIIPWLEFFSGVFLFIGVWVRGSALLINFLLVVFITVLAFNIYRGMDIHCGCFTLNPDSGRSLQIALLEDLVMLAMGIYVFLYQLRKMTENLIQQTVHL